MPAFDYRCSDCERNFEVVVPTLSSERRTDCPYCSSSNTKRVYSAFNIGSAAKSSEPVANQECASCCSNGMCGL